MLLSHGIFHQCCLAPCGCLAGQSPSPSPSHPCSLQMLRLFCSPLPSAHRKHKKGFSSLPQAADEDLMGQNYKPALKIPEFLMTTYSRTATFGEVLSSHPACPFFCPLFPHNHFAGSCRAEGKELSLLQTKQLLKRPDAAAKGRNKSLTKGCDVRGSSIQQVTDIRKLHTQM